MENRCIAGNKYIVKLNIKGRQIIKSNDKKIHLKLFYKNNFVIFKKDYNNL